MATQVREAPKSLRLFDMVLFSVCAMLLLSQVTLIAQIGPVAIVLLALFALAFFVPMGLMTAELGSTYPEAGGIYAWVVRAFGDRWGTRVSWWYWLNVALWVPTVYLMFSSVLSAVFLPDLGFWAQVLIALLLIVVNWVVNLVTLDTAKWVPNLGAIITVAVMALLAIGGLRQALGEGTATSFTWSTDSLVPTLASVSLISIVIYNFVGFELMSSASQEMTDPRRDVPRAILGAGALIAFFYIVAVFGIQAILPYEEISETSGLMDALHASFGQNLFTLLVGLGVLYALFAAIIPWTVGANRAAAEAGGRGDLPPVFAGMSRQDTPVHAAHLTAIVSASFTLLYGSLYSITGGSIDDLFWSMFAFSSVVFLLPYLVMSLAFARLRDADPGADRPYRVPGGRAGALLASGLCVLWLGLAIMFFVVDPFDLEAFEPQTFLMISGGLAVTFALQEWFVARSPRWRAARAVSSPDEGGA